MTEALPPRKQLMILSVDGKRTVTELRQHLHVAETSGALYVYSAEDRLAGDPIKDLERDRRELHDADMVLLIETPDLFNSTLLTSWLLELRSEARHREPKGHRLVVYTIKTRPVADRSPVHGYPVLPRDGHPLLTKTDPASALVEIAQAILNELGLRQPSAPPPPRPLRPPRAPPPLPNLALPPPLLPAPSAVAAPRPVTSRKLSWPAVGRVGAWLVSLVLCYASTMRFVATEQREQRERGQKGLDSLATQISALCLAGNALVHIGLEFPLPPDYRDKLKEQVLPALIDGCPDFHFDRLDGNRYLVVALESERQGLWSAASWDLDTAINQLRNELKGVPDGAKAQSLRTALEACRRVNRHIKPGSERKCSPY